MKLIYKYTFAVILFSTLSSLATAQTPLKITTKPSEKLAVCNAGGKKFDIKNAEDQATCDQMKKPNPKGNVTPPNLPIASPNPISNPPTGN